MKTSNANLLAEIDTLEEIERVDANDLEVVKHIDKQDKRITQLEQEVKELKAYIQKLQAEHVDNISKERKRWAKEDLQALAQHDKEVREEFADYLVKRAKGLKWVRYGAIGEELELFEQLQGQGNDT